MMRVIVNEYVSACPDDTPALFSRTSDFRFFGDDGRLVHRVLPSGDKDYRIINVRTSGHQATHEESERLALTLPLRGWAEVKMDGKSHQVRPGDAIILAPSMRHSALRPQVQSCYESFTVLAPSSLTATMPKVGLLLHANWIGALAAQQLLGLALARAESDRGMPPSVVAAFEALIEDAFVGSLDAGQGDESLITQSRHAEIVERATLYMREHFQQAISITDIARRLGIGPRCLQIAFHERLGQKPRDVLASIRLNALRHDLLRPSPDTSVTSAAMAAGLFHLGRVGKVYLEAFGELPSETLRRTKT